MNRIRYVVGMIIALTLVPMVTRAQVVEERKSEANPSVVVFRATLYGVGTGLLLGGAYALVQDDNDVSTGDCLKWGAAIGAAGGLVVGLVYVATRSEPQGSVRALDAHVGGGGKGDEMRMSLKPGFSVYEDRSGPTPQLRPLAGLQATF